MRAKLLALALLPAVLGIVLSAPAAADPEPTAQPSAGPAETPAPTPPPATESPAPPTESPAPSPSVSETPAPSEPEEPKCELPGNPANLSKKEAVELLEQWTKDKCEVPKKLKASRGDLDFTYSEDVRLTADYLGQTGLSYDGVVTMPTGNGPIRLLKFSMDHARLTDLKQTTKDSTLSTSQLTFDGDVVMYTPKMSGKVFGLVPMTFTPEHPPPLVLPAMFFTDVAVDHTIVLADRAKAENLGQR